MGFQLNEIQHIAIIVSDYETAKKFYTEKLGFKILEAHIREERQDRILLLRVNDTTQLELFVMPDPPKRVTRPEACGLRHLAFQVKSVEETVKELNKRGIVCEPIRTDSFTGRKMTFFRDPDDLPIEIRE